MQNPILKRPEWLVLYLIWWILPGSIHFFVLREAYEVSTNYALLDAGVSFFLLAFLGLSLWYLIRYSDFEKARRARSIQTLVLAMFMLFLIWASLSYALISLWQKDVGSHFLESGLWRSLIFLPSYAMLMILYALLSFQQQVKDHQLTEMRMHNLLKETELKALKSQINPHFLFNSLNSASSLTLYNPEKAREMIVLISDFFRKSLMLGKKQFSTIEEEMSYALLYLEIEKARFGEKIVVVTDVDSEVNNVKIPAFVFQPLVENAVKHGVYESSIPIQISFVIKPYEQGLKIRIHNNLDIESGSYGKGTGTGLQNVSSRLALVYGKSDIIKWKKSDKDFMVEITLPDIITGEEK